MFLSFCDLNIPNAKPRNCFFSGRPSAEVCQSYGAPCHISFEDKMRVSIMRAMRPKKTIGNESAPIQLAQYPFPGLAISNAKTLIYFFQIKYAKQFYQTALGNCYGLKLPKRLFQFKNKNYCVIYYNLRHTFVPYGIILLILQTSRDRSAAEVTVLEDHMSITIIRRGSFIQLTHSARQALTKSDAAVVDIVKLKAMRANQYLMCMPDNTVRSAH